MHSAVGVVEEGGPAPAEEVVVEEHSPVGEEEPRPGNRDRWGGAAVQQVIHG